MEDTYLGDGVYASFDGYQVWLDLRAQDGFPFTPGGHPGIALEGVVLGALNDYVERIKAAAKKAAPDA